MAKRGVLEMEGFPTGLRQAITEARTHLVFLHDDRAPIVVCKQWYQREMARYLADEGRSRGREEVVSFWDEVIQGSTETGKIGVKATLQNVFGFRCGEGIVYNYGIWKPT